MPNSGAGGLTQGTYDLKLDFTPAAVTHLTDLDGNVLAGNSQGVEEYNGMLSVLKSHPGIKFIGQKPFNVTNWDAAHWNPEHFGVKRTNSWWRCPGAAMKA